MSEAYKVRIVRFWLAFAVACCVATWEPSLWFGLVPLFFTGQGGCFCCPLACTILSDDFSVDNLATNWDDRVGTWAVSLGRLITTSASALIVTIAEQAAGRVGSYATADITCAATSDIGRMVIAYVDDDNYWFCEIQPGATNGTLKLFERSGGTNTQRGTTQTLPNYSAGDTATVCIGIGFGFVTTSAIHAGTNVMRISYLATVTAENTAAGCGTGAGSSDVKFDNFLFGVHVDDDPTCYNCAPCQHCDPDYSGRFQVVISGVVTVTATCDLGIGYSDCADCNGTYEVIYWGQNPYPATFPDTCQWRCQADIDLTGCPPTADIADLRVDVHAVSGGIQSVRIGVNEPSSIMAWINGSPPPDADDCAAYSSANITPGSSTNCGLAGSTCLLTALGE